MAQFAAENGLFLPLDTVTCHCVFNLTLIQTYLRCATSFSKQPLSGG